MKTTDSALLGHVSGDALAAAALSDLWTMCTGVLVQGRVLGILVGAAVGAGNPKLAGIYLQVSYVVLFSIAIIVIIAWLLTERVWVAFGSDPTIARDAGYYASAMATGIPGVICFSQLSQYFSAQRILAPEVNTASLGLILNLILGLIFVLGIPISNFAGYGFRACPIVTTVIVYAQLVFIYVVYIHYGQLHRAGWDGWSLRRNVTRSRITTFCTLYIPAAMGMASDFWRVAVIGAVAAKLGETDVAVFNTSYRIMWIVLIMVNALSGAAGIKMSLRLGRVNPAGAKQAGHVGVFLSFVVLALLFFAIVTHVRWFGRIFTNDEEFLALFESARWPFTITLVLMNLSVAIEKIPYSMGRTSDVFWMGLVASWGAQVPAVFVMTTYWRNDLVGLYWGMAIGYMMLCFLYGYIAFTSDWDYYATVARNRSEMKN